MESFANALKTQLSDYMDIEKIFIKLEEEKSLQMIHDVLQRVVSDSAKSILKGTIEKHIDGLDDRKLRGTYEKNLSMFKSKFLVIIQMMTENIFSSDLLKETPQRNTEENITTRRPHLWINSAKSTRESELITESARMTPKNRSPVHSINLTESARMTPKNRSPAHSAKTKKGNKSKRVSPANTKIKEVSYVLRKKSASGTKKKLESTNTSTAKFFDSSKFDGSPYSKCSSLSNTILASSPMNKSSRTDRTTDRGEKSFARTPVSPIHLALGQSSNLNPSSFMLQHLNSSLHSVQSEFNHIRGPSTFRQAPRESWIDIVARTESPGPGKYTPKNQSGSRSPSMGKSPRRSWVDEAARTESPGPGKYSPRLKDSPSAKFGKAMRKSWIDEVARTDSPGPGSYTPKNQSGSRSPSMDRTPRVSWIDVVARTDSPGPGKYTARSGKSSPSHSMGKSPRKSWVDEVAWTDSPGPAVHYGSTHYLSK